MHTHRFIFITRSGKQSSEPFEFVNNDMAVVCARSLLSDRTVAVAVRRVERAGTTSRVGLWVWRHGAPEWKLGE